MATRQYVRKTGVDSNELQGPDAPSVTMPRSGDFTSDDVPDIQVVADVPKEKDDWATKMAFMEELVTIRLHETRDANDEPRVPVCVNGEKSHPQFGNHLPRGMELAVKRKVAEVLLRSKPISVRTVKTVDHDGNDTARIERSVGSKYPFELVSPRPRDLEWVKRVRAEA